MEQAYDANIKIKDLFNILGKKKYSNDLYQNENPPGVSVGLAWTSVGGDILFIETSICEGKGNLTITGNLGNVFKESANTALSYLRSRAKDLNIPQDAFNNFNLHLHVPEWATPKDGPSAGIAIFTAFASQLTQRRVKPFLAMTGEITLRGKVLPVGGIKEIILCKENEKDILDINQDFLKGLTFHYVDHVDEVMALSLEKTKVKDALNFIIKTVEKK